MNNLHKLRVFLDYENIIKEFEVDLDYYNKEIKRLNNIIKEVREYINTDKNCVPKHILDYINNLLDKGE